MPFGIINAKHDGSLPGTELLIGDEREDIVPEAEARRLKRVVIKVRRAPSAIGTALSHRWNTQGEEIILVPQPNDADPNDPVVSRPPFAARTR